MVRFLMALFVAVVASVPAAADTAVFFGIGDGGRHRHHRHHWHGPGWGYEPYWGRPYPRPRSTVFLYSAPVYVPPPRRVIHYPAYAPAVVPTSQCTFFNGDAVIDGSGQPFYGRACLFTDGRWHIVP